jgi:hypothetical protein
MPGLEAIYVCSLGDLIVASAMESRKVRTAQSARMNPRRWVGDQFPVSRQYSRVRLQCESAILFVPPPVIISFGNQKYFC